MDLKHLAKAGLEKTFDKKYEKLLSEKTVSYNDWIQKEEAGYEHFDLSVFDEQAEIISENRDLNWKSEYTCKFGDLNFHIVSMDVCRFGYNVRQYIEDIVIFVNGRLSEIAVPLIADFFEKHPKAVAVYGDEDILSISGQRVNPYFKPEFSPNELLSHFYFCNMVAIRRSAFRDMDWTGEMTGAESLYHNLLRMIYSDKKYIDYGVGHIEAVLLHAQDYSNASISDDAAEKFAQKLRDLSFFNKNAERAISVVICTKDHPDMLETCLSKLEEAKGDFTLEYVLVDNGSSEENVLKIKAISNHIPFKYIYEPADFNFSAMCNSGAKAATKSMLLFLNDDVEISDPAVFERLWNTTAYGFTGAAGVKLLYPQDNRIQHSGIVNTPPGPVHKLQGMADDTDYYYGFNRVITNRIAVTGACLCIRRAVFEEIGGFDVDFPVAYNDVDLCYRLLEKGYYIACCNDVFAIHKESVTRGADVSDDKAKRLAKDRERLYRLHPLIGRRDPFYNSRLLSEVLDPRIVPANSFRVKDNAQLAETFAEADFSDAREDGCLFATVEFAGPVKDYIGGDSKDFLLQGFGVLTGSNNACYSKQLLLQNGAKTYAIELDGCIRPDLEAALPDEKNIGLSGFSIIIPEGKLPEGSYRVGVLFKRELSKEKIFNFTNKYLVIGE